MSFLTIEFCRVAIRSLMLIVLPPLMLNSFSLNKYQFPEAKGHVSIPFHCPGMGTGTEKT